MIVSVASLIYLLGLSFCHRVVPQLPGLKDQFKKISWNTIRRLQSEGSIEAQPVKKTVPSTTPPQYVQYSFCGYENSINLFVGEEENSQSGDVTTLYYGPYNMCIDDSWEASFNGHHYYAPTPTPSSDASSHGWYLKKLDDGGYMDTYVEYNTSDCSGPGAEHASDNILVSSDYCSASEAANGVEYVTISSDAMSFQDASINSPFIQYGYYYESACGQPIYLFRISTGVCFPTSVINQLFCFENANACDVSHPSAQPSTQPAVPTYYPSPQPTPSSLSSAYTDDDGCYHLPDGSIMFNSDFTYSFFCDNDCQGGSQVNEDPSADGAEIDGVCHYAGGGYQMLTIYSPIKMTQEEIILESSPFEIEWTPQFVAVKVRKYFVGYILYFAGLFILLFVVDKSGFFKSLSKLLHDSANTAKKYACEATSPETPWSVTDVKYLKSIAERAQRSLPEIADVQPKESDQHEKKSTLDSLRDSWTKFAPYPIDQTTAAYPKAFYEYLEQGYSYFGCHTTYFHGVLGSCVCKTLLMTPVQLQDYTLYVFNNHSLLSCMVAAKKSFFSRSKRRIAFSMQHSLAFFLVAFNVSLTSVGMPESMAVLFNLFLIAPLLTTFNKLFQQLLICSCLRDGPMKERFASFVQWIDASGYFIAGCMMCGGFLMLLFATFFSTGTSSFGILGEYALQVQFYSFLMELVNARMRCVSCCYVNMKFVCFGLFHPDVWAVIFGDQDWISSWLSFTLGERFVEIIVRDNLVPNIDYVDLSYPKYRCAMFHVEILMEKSLAVARGWKVSEAYSSKGVSNPMQENGRREENA